MCHHCQLLPLRSCQHCDYLSPQSSLSTVTTVIMPTSVIYQLHHCNHRQLSLRSSVPTVSTTVLATITVGTTMKRSNNSQLLRTKPITKNYKQTVVVNRSSNRKMCSAQPNMNIMYFISTSMQSHQQIVIFLSKRK